ncbi:MAG: molecular chaperone TorD family protein [Nannocystales bacterium]
MVTTDAQRVRGYRVLARLLEDGAAGVPAEIAAVFDASADPGELRSQYVAAFDLGVPPYASVFLESDRCVGGQVTAALADRMETGAATGPAACHLAVQLEHVARRLEAGDGEEAVAFLREALLAWLPALAVVLEDQPVPFWRTVVSQALDLAADHSRKPEASAAGMRPAVVPPPLGDASGLSDIAAWLATPSAVGTFISDADVVAIGRILRVPRGFGTRAQRIETLLRSAADYGCVASTADALADLLSRRRQSLLVVAQTHALAELVAPWVERLGGGLGVLQALRDGSTD